MVLPIHTQVTDLVCPFISRWLGTCTANAEMGLHESGWSFGIHTTGWGNVQKR